MNGQEALIQTLKEIEVEPSPELLGKFHLYFELLQEWNQKMNLTSITEEEAVYEKHFIDSLLPAKSLYFKNKTVLDIGSGGGFPGLVLALVFPEAKVTVLDATAKKFLFLKEVTEKLGLTNVSFVNARIEERKVAYESFDVAISRGFALLPIFLECAAPFVKKGGHVLAMKGSGYEEEMKKANNAQKLGLSFLKADLASLPSGDSRATLIYKKNGVTPRKYPRRWDEMSREYR